MATVLNTREKLSKSDFESERETETDERNF